MGGNNTQNNDSPPDSDVFALVGNEVRIQIIKSLGDAQGTRGPPAVCSFAELRSEVGPRMDSSRFNYHLQQLVGHYVANVDEGYRLNPEGTTLYRTLRAGALDEYHSIEPVPVDTACHFCDDSLEALYDGGRYTVRCRGCDHVYSRLTIPPHAVGDGITDELIRRVDMYARSQYIVAASGVCPVCIGSLDIQMLPADEVTLTGNTTDDLTLFVHASCEHCGHQQYLNIGSALLHHPTVVTFLYNRGLDVLSMQVWELAFAVTDECITVESTDPWRVIQRIERNGDELELVVNDDLELVDRTLIDS